MGGTGSGFDRLIRMIRDTIDATEAAGDGESSERLRATWDGTGSASTAVVEADATANGRDPLEMPPLYDALDAESLDDLMAADGTGVRRNVSVSFSYDGAFVLVDSGGTIEVAPEGVRSA